MDLCALEAPEEAARHAARGGEPTRALQLALRAATSLAPMHGPHEAAELLLEILEATKIEPTVEVATQLAELLIASGDFLRARPHVERVLSERSDDPTAALLHARALAGSGELERARDELCGALERVEDPELAAELELELADVEYRRGDPKEPQRRATEVARVAAAEGFLALELKALAISARTTLGLRDLDEAERLAEEGFTRAEQAGLGRQACDLLNILGNVAWQRHDLVTARQRFERLVGLAKDCAEVLREAIAHENLAVTDHILGHLGRAARGYQPAYRVVVRTGMLPDTRKRRFLARPARDGPSRIASALAAA